MPGFTSAHGITAMVLHKGLLCIGDRKGVVTVLDAHHKVRWRTKPKGVPYVGKILADSHGLYVGTETRVFALDRSGKVRWSVKVRKLLDAWLGRSGVYVCGWGEGVSVFDAGGERVALYESRGALQAGGANEDESLVFAGTQGMLVAWNADRKRSWTLRLARALPTTIVCRGERLFVMTAFEGLLSCIDISAKALAAAEKGPFAPPKMITLAAPKPVRQGEAPGGEGADAGSIAGVVVECYRDGDELRVRVVSKGYHRDWACQFPRNLRVEGARYVVEKVTASSKGSFYRAGGDIRRLTAR